MIIKDSGTGEVRVVVEQVNPEAAGMDVSRLTRAFGVMQGTIERHVLLGSGVVVVRHGQVVAERYWGRATREPALHASADTIWAMASVTKPVAASAVLLLIERGAFRLDDPVAAVLPAFGQNGKEGVTIRHLLTHTSGLDQSFESRLDRSQMTVESYRDAIYAAGLSAPPGTQVSYCNPAFTLLGSLISEASGVDHVQFIQDEIFLPLGMTSTRLRPGPDAIARLADCDGFSQPAALQHILTSGTLAGGMVSSPRDIARFGQLFLNSGRWEGQRILSPTTIAAMARNLTAGLPDVGATPPRPVISRGLGWRLNLDGTMGAFLTPRAYGHGGASGTMLLMDPELELVISFVDNRWGWNGRERDLFLNAITASIVE